MAKVRPRAKEKSPEATKHRAPVHSVRLKTALHKALKIGTLDRFDSFNGEGIWISKDSIGPNFPRLAVRADNPVGPRYPREALVAYNAIGPKFPKLAGDIGPHFPRLIGAARYIDLV